MRGSHSDRSDRAAVTWFAAVGVAALGGCAGSLDVASLSALGQAALTAKPSASEVFRSQVSTQETYIRLARGANRCWFGAHGAFRDSHVFYADLEANSKGTAADISIHERIKGGERPWGLKALRVTIAPVAEQADVTITNLKMSEADAARMAGDVQRWLSGAEDCGQPVATPPVASTAAAAAPVAPAPAEQPKRGP